MTLPPLIRARVDGFRKQNKIKVKLGQFSFVPKHLKREPEFAGGSR
jgi:hypothetical protein